VLPDLLTSRCTGSAAIGTQGYRHDNINPYYNERLKYERLKRLALKNLKSNQGNLCRITLIDLYQFIRMDLNDRERLDALFETKNFFPYYPS
jgi:hypothetical protein